MRYALPLHSPFGGRSYQFSEQADDQRFLKWEEEGEGKGEGEGREREMGRGGNEAMTITEPLLTHTNRTQHTLCYSNTRGSWSGGQTAGLHPQSA